MMKRTRAYCGMFEDDDDLLLVRCQGPVCSVRSVDYEIPAGFHERCADALGHSGGARWQNCPWCPPVIGVDVSAITAPIVKSFSPAPEESCAAPSPLAEYISWWIQGLHLMRRSTSAR